MVKYAEHRKFDLTESKMAMAKIRNSVSVILNQVNYFVYLISSKQAMLCYSWLESWYRLVGEYNPSNREIHLEPMLIKDVYDEYLEDYKDSQSLVTITSFCWIWKNLYPNVKIRQFKAVMGKLYFILFL